MDLIRRLSLARKALHELGPQSLAYYAWYQLLLRSGYLLRSTSGDGRVAATQTTGSSADSSSVLSRPLLSLPSPDRLAALLGDQGVASLLSEADEIAAGQVRLFGGPPVPLQLVPPQPLLHWTMHEKGQGIREEAGLFQNDIKFIWEPARFGWTFTLGRAYRLSGDERYPAVFWDNTETFLQANPPYQGPHWASAQEVALRLIAFTFALQVLAGSPHTTPERAARLAQAVAGHAARIPPTLAYARAQNNNHLLTEAVGLYTAGLALPDHPEARRWRSLGWRWLNWALQNQIAAGGDYIQHSANYHRLMLQAALWAHCLASRQDQPLPEATRRKLAAATRWLLALLDSTSGRVPNLGPNDGANILPLAVCPFEDYRPTLQAAAAAFLGERPFLDGPWDELSLWLNVESSMLKGHDSTLIFQTTSPHVLRTSHSWAYLRLARFTARPGHADQLHLDLWWRGLNVAQDAGTYLYNAPPPWENALSSTAVHNTVTINGQDQMTRLGRFLYLDWAQANIVSAERAQDGSWQRLTAHHDGYRRLGVIHERTVECRQERWLVTDRLLQVERSKSKGQDSTFNLPPLTATLHWLLPDRDWQMVESGEARIEVRLQSPYGPVTLSVTNHSPLHTPLSSLSARLIRAADLLYGAGPVPPISGWVSPTYGVKIPALSFEVSLKGPLPLTLLSEFTFPGTILQPLP